MEERKEIDFGKFEFREVEPTLKEMKMSRSTHKIVLYPRRIYINKALEEIGREIMADGLQFKPKYVRFLIDEKNQWIALKFEDQINDMNLSVHYSSNARVYVLTPITIAGKYKDIMSKKRDKITFQPTYVPYHYHNGMLLFCYAKEEAST